MMVDIKKLVDYAIFLQKDFKKSMEFKELVEERLSVTIREALLNGMLDLSEYEFDVEFGLSLVTWEATHIPEKDRYIWELPNIVVEDEDTGYAVLRTYKSSDGVHLIGSVGYKYALEFIEKYHIPITEEELGGWLRDQMNNEQHVIERKYQEISERIGL